MQAPVLSANIQKKLSNFKLEVHTEIQPGITALFGPSGAGKSMLVKIFGGLENADNYHLILNGRDITQTPIHRRNIGFVFQDHRLFPHMSVKNNLRYGMELDKHSTIKLEDIISFLGIEKLLDQKPAQLSGGEAQRVAIGRAMLSNPELLIMDEPLSSIDQARKEDILRLIEKLRDTFQQNILYITHSLDEVLQLADHLIIMDHGKIIANGPLMETLSRPQIFPLTGAIEAGCVFEGQIVSYDQRLNLTIVNSDAGPVHVTGFGDKAIGEKVRLRIRSRDITLSAQQNTSLSTLNRFKGKILNINEHKPGVMLVTVDAGVALTAAITLKSMEDLKLKTGSTVWAMTKSVTIHTAAAH
jgi:molybdate transport system ATP-binding protein